MAITRPTLLADQIRLDYASTTFGLAFCGLDRIQPGVITHEHNRFVKLIFIGRPAHRFDELTGERRPTLGRSGALAVALFVVSERPHKGVVVGGTVLLRRTILGDTLRTWTPRMV